MLGVRIGLGAHRRIVLPAGPMTAAAVTGVRADGWSADYTSPPAFDPVGDPKYIVLSRQGFDGTGASKTYVEPVVLTQRVRQAYSAAHSTAPADYTNAGVVSNPWLDASRVALSRYVYSTDTILSGSGPANNSTAASPKPVAQWITHDRRVVANSLTVELAAMHINARNGEQIACVEFTASDGATTLTQKVSASAVSSGAYDIAGLAVLSYKATFDTTTLTDGATLTINAKVYPWIGGTSAVLDSSTGSTTARGFGPLKFRKMVSLAANPLCAYVSTTGNNGTAVISQTVATALTSPYATIGAAFDALRASTAGGKSAGQLDGCEIRMMAGSHAFTAPSFYAEASVCACIVRSAPGESAATVTMTLGAAMDFVTPFVRFQEIRLRRTGYVYFVTGNTRTWFAGCVLDGNAQGVQIMGNGVVYIEGGSIINEPGAVAASSNAKFVLRALTMTSANNQGIDSWGVIGCALANPSIGNGGQDASGTLIMFNKLLAGGGTNAMIAITGGSSGALATYAGIGVGQNVIEWSSATSAPAVRLSGDGEFANLAHVCLHHNTMAGFNTYGRVNDFYNESAGVNARTHTLISDIGNIYVQKNTKHDVYAGVVIGVTGRTQSWGYMYGVECLGNLSRYADAAGFQEGTGSHFSQACPGLSSQHSAATNGAGLNPLFTSYAGTTIASAAGAGNGTYTLQAGSPCEGKVTTPVFRFDLAGNGRGAGATAIGAYRGAAE